MSPPPDNDDDDEELGAWIYKSSRFAKAIADAKTGAVSSTQACRKSPSLANINQAPKNHVSDIDELPRPRQMSQQTKQRIPAAAAGDSSIASPKPGPSSSCNGKAPAATVVPPQPCPPAPKLSQPRHDRQQGQHHVAASAATITSPAIIWSTTPKARTQMGAQLAAALVDGNCKIICSYALKKRVLEQLDVYSEKHRGVCMSMKLKGIGVAYIDDATARRWSTEKQRREIFAAVQCGYGKEFNLTKKQRTDIEKQIGRGGHHQSSGKHKCKASSKLLPRNAIPDQTTS